MALSGCRVSRPIHASCKYQWQIQYVLYTYAHLSGTWRTNSVTLGSHSTWLVTHLMVSFLHEGMWNRTTPCFTSLLHGCTRQELTYPRISLGATTSHSTRRHNSYVWPACAWTYAWFLWQYPVRGRREKSSAKLCLFLKNKRPLLSGVSSYVSQRCFDSVILPIAFGLDKAICWRSGQVTHVPRSAEEGYIPWCTLLKSVHGFLVSERAGLHWNLSNSMSRIAF